MGGWSLILLVEHVESTSQDHCTRGEKVLEYLSSNAHQSLMRTAFVVGYVFIS